MFARHAGPAALLLAAAALGSSCTSHREKTSPTDGWTLIGSKQGQSAALVDWDGDGIQDKLVGAPYATSASGSVGAVLVYVGRGSGFATQPAAVLAGDDNFGFSVADVGDLDGDGRSDFAVAAIAGDGEGASLCGAVTVFRGGTRGEKLVKLSGGVPLAKFGYALAAGDFDGDGHRDLAIGAPFHTEDPALYQAGAVHVFFGPDFSRSLQLSATSGAQGLGWSVAAGDLDGDGRADLLLGAAGKVIGFYGSTPFAPSFAAPDVVVGGSAGSLGRALAVVGDVDGDGLPELAIGAPGATFGGGRDSGSLYLVRGGPGPRSVNLDASPADPSLLVRIDGSGAFQRFGASVVAVADLDADGRADLAVGAPLADVPGMPLAGRVYLLEGKDLGPGASLASATAFGGVTRSQGFGSSLWPCAGGRLLIGAPRAEADTGGVAMVDLATGLPVPGGGSGGADGGGNGDCH
ncbi:MAG TPA: FG-GAP-like repeat-containing protein [Anaeromyxobacter sp.]